MKGRLESLEKYLKDGRRDNSCTPQVLHAIAPAIGRVIWFDMKGEPHRVLGFGLCSHDRKGLLSYPIIDMPYDLPMMDVHIELAKQFGYQSIFYDEVSMDDVVDNFLVYRKYVNALEDRESYISKIEAMGMRIK